MDKIEQLWEKVNDQESDIRLLTNQVERLEGQLQVLMADMEARHSFNADQQAGLEKLRQENERRLRAAEIDYEKGINGI